MGANAQIGRKCSEEEFFEILLGKKPYRNIVVIKLGAFKLPFVLVILMLIY